MLGYGKQKTVFSMTMFTDQCLCKLHVRLLNINEKQGKVITFVAMTNIMLQDHNYIISIQSNEAGC